MLSKVEQQGRIFRPRIESCPLAMILFALVLWPISLGGCDDSNEDTADLIDLSAVEDKEEEIGDIAPGDVDFEQEIDSADSDILPDSVPEIDGLDSAEDEVEEVEIILPSCPSEIPNTGELDGFGITRKGFGCYGACGPACETECEAPIEFVYSVQGTEQCARCTYTVLSCKSHEFCRWHDDCYRQCSRRWEALHEEDPPSAPNNACYRNCDLPVAETSYACGIDWAQLFEAEEPDIGPECWDGSFVVFSKLVEEELVDGICEGSSDNATRPFAGQAFTWDSSIDPPTELTQDESCGMDEHCPDRNQYCELDIAEPVGLNGPGRCWDLEPSPMIDVRPLEAVGTREASQISPIGALCLFGFDCWSGWCVDGVCSQEPG